MLIKGCWGVDACLPPAALPSHPGRLSSRHLCVWLRVWREGGRFVTAEEIAAFISLPHTSVLCQMAGRVMRQGACT